VNTMSPLARMKGLQRWFAKLSATEKKEALRRLRREDNDALYAIAMSVKEEHSIRRMAVLGLQEQELLCRIAKLADDASLRDGASNRIFKPDPSMPVSTEERSLFREEPHLFLQQAVAQNDTVFLEYIARTCSGSIRHAAILALPDGCYPEAGEERALYFLQEKLARRENDVPLLMRAAVHGPHRWFAFARLTGQSFYEPCDAYSHCTFECGQAEGVTDEQIRQTCRTMIEDTTFDERLVEEARKLLQLS